VSAVPRALALRLRALLHRGAVERDLEEEIRLHLELETAKYLREGLSPADAERRARVAFGGVEAVKEGHRDARGTRLLEDFLGDVRYGWRVLRRNRALTGAAVLTLALGLGANTAIFSAVNAVILRPLPFPASGRLVALGENNVEKSWHMQVAAPANMLDWRDRVAAFEDVAGWADWGMGTETLTGEGEPRPIHVALVTGNFFAVLGVRAERGRVLQDAETWSPSGSGVAVISHRLWRDQLGSRPDAVGHTIRLDGRALEVVGVMPSTFAFPYAEGDVWLPVAWDPASRAADSFRRAHWMRPIARLRSGVSLSAADAQLQVVVRRLQREHPDLDRGMGASMVPLHDYLVGGSRQPLLVLMAAALLLLLIACANVGNLLLVQAAGREREAALRLSLGAGRGRLVRQALTESLVLSLLGGAAGLALGWWGTRALAALQPRGLLPVADVPMSWAALGYVLGIALLGGLGFGVAPALWSARRAPADVLKDGSRSVAGRRMRAWSDALAAGEVALAILLTLGSGLLLRSYWRLEHVDPGFDPHGVLAADVNAPGARYPTPERILAFFDGLETRVAAIPGAEEVAAASRIPLTDVAWTSDFTVAGRPPDAYGVDAGHREVTPAYFRLMRVPLLRGRLFTAADDAGAPPVIIINRQLAQRYFAGQDPIGQRICFDRKPDSTSQWRTIVGVVGGERQASLATEPKIEIFAPHAQEGYRSGMIVLVRTAGDPLTLLPAVRAALAEVDPDVAIRSATTLDAVREDAAARQRFIMTLLLVFAGCGVLLAVVGVYGVMAQLAVRRTHEMGIRIALGARPAAVRWLVVRHALALVALGTAVGVAAAAVTTRAMRSLLYQVAPTDAATFVAVPALLALAALAASWLPALRASRADPAAALRAE
jgi:putative ABC transport system permease protein